MTDHQDSQLAEAPRVTVLLSPEGLEEIIDILGVVEPTLRSQLCDTLVAEAESYLLNRSVEPYWGIPGEQRKALRQLLKRLNGTLDAMDAIAPEYAVALDALLEPDEKRDTSRESIFLEAEQSISRLGRLIVRFDAEYKPKKGRAPDLILEEAVRNLIGVIEPITGQFPQVQMNKHNGENPALKSPEARAIGKLLQFVDPSLNEVRIVNMIEKLRTQPHESEWHLDALDRLDPYAELDASLLGNRYGD